MAWGIQDYPSPAQVAHEAATAADEEHASRPSLLQLLAPNRPSRVLPWRSDQPQGEDEPDNEPNWPAAIELIRDVGARMRQARRYAQDVVQHSQAVIDGAMQRLEDTERRLRQAEAAAREAQARAERAELAAQMADARARRAEHETELNRAKLAEAQMWLKRLYSSVQIEFREVSQDDRP